MSLNVFFKPFNDLVNSVKSCINGSPPVTTTISDELSVHNLTNWFISNLGKLSFGQLFFHHTNDNQYHNQLT